jgi:hypothetical protein
MDIRRRVPCCCIAASKIHACTVSLQVYHQPFISIKGEERSTYKSYDRRGDAPNKTDRNGIVDNIIYMATKDSNARGPIDSLVSPILLFSSTGDSVRRKNAPV